MNLRGLNRSAAYLLTDFWMMKPFDDTLLSVYCTAFNFNFYILYGAVAVVMYFVIHILTDSA
jgi:phage terminase small subunit